MAARGATERDLAPIFGYTTSMADDKKPKRYDPLWILDLAQTRAAATIAAIAPEQLHLPTPCDEWDVRDVINKMVASTLLFTSFGQRTEPDAALDLINPKHIVGDDPLGAFQAAAAECRAAWRAEGAMDGMAPSTIGEAPAKAVLHARIFDTTILSWDIATATGVAHGIDDIQATYVQRIASALVPAVRGHNSARYKDQVDTVENSSAVDRLVATTGRDPNWAPSAT